MDALVDHVVFESVACPVVVLDRYGGIVRANHACERARGQTRAELVGRRFWGLFGDPVETSAVQERFERLIAGGAAEGHESDWVDGDGLCRRIAWSYALAGGEEGEARFIVATGLDVTEQRVAEQSYRRAHELNRRVLEVVPGGVAQVSPAGEVQIANAAAQEFLGLVFDETRRVYVSDFTGKTIREDGRDFPVEDYPVSRCLRTGEPQPPAVVGVTRPDGRTLWGLFSAMPLRDSERECPGGALVTFLDITDRIRAADALRASEEWLRAAFADAPIGMVLGDLKGHILRVNAAYCRITGYTEADLLGRQFLSITHPDDRERNATLVTRLMAGEISTAVMQKRYITSDGGVVWAQISVGVARDPGGRPQTFVVLVQDITERRRAEELLRESERRFRQLAEAIDGVFWMIDADSKEMLYVSPAYERLWGRSCESLYREPGSFSDAIHPDDRARVLAEIRPIPEKGVEVQYRVVRPDGSEVWIHDRAFPIRNERGEVYRLAGIAHDVTEHKHSEQAIRAMNEHLERLVAERTADAQEQSRILRSVLQSMGEAVIVADQQGNVMLTNLAAARFAGPPNPEPHSVESCAVPQYLFKSDGVTPYAGHELPLSRAVAGEAVDQEEMLIARHDRPERVWISATARPLRDESGKLAGGVLVARDTTERRRVDELLRESERHHREAAEHNRLLVRELEHRVRNNLAGLLGLVSVMQERMTDVRAFGRAMESRLRAMAHVQQLLATTEWRALDLRVLIDSLISAMDFMLPWLTEVTLSGPSVSIPPRRALPLTLILAEWLTNSCKYGAHSQAGGRLQIGWELGLAAGPQSVRICWEETGGPTPSDAVVPSLGTDLVQAFASRELDGVCQMGFPQTGARHVLEFSVCD
ncbi:MAG: signal transduction histidine kinase [Phycisphaerales bacterium]|nr:signal transduction histidine kinase [Phycisphaerales bacterium]